MIIRTSEDIGGAIYEARHRRRMTQIELARQAGVTSRWLREIEHGKATAEIGLVLRVMGFLGLTLEIANVGAKKDSVLEDDDFPDKGSIVRMI